MPRDMNGFVAVIRQVAVLQGGVVYYVAFAFRPFLKKVDGIVKGHDFPDPVLSPVQLNRSCKHSRVHLTSLNTTVFNKKGAVDAPAVDLLPSVPWFKRLHPILVADHRSAAWLGCPARFRSCNAHR